MWQAGQKEIQNRLKTSYTGNCENNVVSTMVARGNSTNQ